MAKIGNAPLSHSTSPSSRNLKAGGYGTSNNERMQENDSYPIAGDTFPFMTSNDFSKLGSFGQ
jgi:hypothetical protein